MLRVTVFIGVVALAGLGSFALVHWGLDALAPGALVHDALVNDALTPGRVAPPIRAQGWLNGEAPTPEGLAGKVVLLDAWASW